MSQNQPETGVAAAMPQTPEELHIFISNSLMKIFSIPENALILATTMTQAQLRAMTTSVKKDEGLMKPELVLARTEFKGSIRAEVTDADAETGLLDVILSTRSEADPEQWTTELDFTPEQQAAFKRAVLAQTALPHDVYFITTTLAVNQAHEEAATVLFDRSAEINRMAEEAEQVAKAQQA